MPLSSEQAVDWVTCCVDGAMWATLMEKTTRSIGFSTSTTLVIPPTFLYQHAQQRDGRRTFRFNGATCDSSNLTRYHGSLVEPHGNDDSLGVIPLTVPSISGRFGDRSAAFIIKIFFYAYAAVEQTSIEISFIGTIGHSRSDELVDRDQPQWKSTMGFSKSLYGPIEGIAGRVRRCAGYCPPMLFVMWVLK